MATRYSILDRGRPDGRTINWIWSEAGNTGKTSFCKYLTVHHGAIPCAGKSADMFNSIIDYVEKNGDTPRIVLIPIPRSFNMEYLNYHATECILDSYFYSGKYKGGVVCGNSPHVIVFANEPPTLTKCSIDRWRVRQIDGDDVWTRYDDTATPILEGHPADEPFGQPFHQD